MIETITLENKAGELLASGPICWFVLNHKQQFIVLGVDFSDGKEWNADSGTNGIDQQPLGKLSEQNFIFQSQITNSLNIEGWDYESYPDPEIIILTDNRNISNN